MCIPRTSREGLLEMITSKREVTLAEIRDYAGGPDVNFGPGVDVIDVLVAIRSLGKI